MNKIYHLDIKGPYEILSIYDNNELIAEVLLLGTAHVSNESVEDVENAINQYKPHIVCVELCEPRHESLLDSEKWKNLDITKVIKEKKIALLASNLILSSFQKKIGLMTGTKPGEEMFKASQLARENSLRLILIDREIRITLLRAWRNISFWNKLWLMNYLFVSLLFAEDISKEQIEQLKQKDALEDLFENLPKKYEFIKQIILTERDQYMAENIRRVIYNIQPYKEYKYNSENSNENNTNLKKILAVVGAGHLKGIREYLMQNQPFDLEKLTYVPEQSPIRTILTWIFLTLIIAVFTYLFMIEGKSAKELVLVWAISRSVGAGLGAVLALAHPLTILVTIVMAPFSVFIPGTRLWMYAALIEVWFNKPRVEDFERIAEDTMDLKNTLKALYKNRVLKLFWIISLVSTGLTIGNLAFLQKFIAKLIDLFL